jgi:hypothetical protein
LIFNNSDDVIIQVVHKLNYVNRVGLDVTVGLKIWINLKFKEVHHNQL